MIEPTALEHWLDHFGGPVVIDEAYVDFAETNAIGLTTNADVIVTRRSASRTPWRAFASASASPIRRSSAKWSK